MATSADQLILRGMHILMRCSMRPADPALDKKHLQSVAADANQWNADYVEEISKPAVDFTLTPIPDEPGGLN